MLFVSFGPTELPRKAFSTSTLTSRSVLLINLCLPSNTSIIQSSSAYSGLTRVPSLPPIPPLYRPGDPRRNRDPSFAEWRARRRRRRHPKRSAAPSRVIVTRIFITVPPSPLSLPFRIANPNRSRASGRSEGISPKSPSLSLSLRDRCRSSKQNQCAKKSVRRFEREKLALAVPLLRTFAGVEFANETISYRSRPLVRDNETVMGLLAMQGPRLGA